MKRTTRGVLPIPFVVPVALGLQFLAVGVGRDVDASGIAACPDDAGRGGATAVLASATQGGNGCAVVDIDGDLTTFVYTGALQTWTVPSGVTSVRVHLIGAGGGGGRSGTSAYGGGGGYATGILGVSAGQTFDVIVGGGGIRQCTGDVPALNNVDARRNFSFGGGASGNGSAAYDCTFAAGGGRSAIRIGGTSSDIVTAGGGGGGGYNGAGGAGGGLVGSTGGGTGGTGGSQSDGGATASPEPGVAGVQYAGGWAGFSNSALNAASEAGGGGGGYYGGGAGGDNGGGGGGSSFLGTLTDASTVAGSGREAGVDPPVKTTSPSVPTRVDIGATAQVTPGVWTHVGESTYQWQQSSDNVTFTDVTGATGTIFVPDSAGYIRVVETRKNFLGSVAAHSNVATVADTSLSALAVSAGVLTPAFTAAQRTYSVSVPFRTKSVKLTPVAAANNATVRIDGVAVPAGSSSGDVDLVTGANAIAVVVSVGPSSTTTTVSVVRAAALVPGRPTIDDVTAGDGSITVSFTSPSDDGGDDITSHEYSLDGQTWVTVNGNGNGKFLISRLTNGTPVSVQLRAVNSAGAGTASVSRSVVPVAPTTTTVSTVAPTTTPTSSTTSSVVTSTAVAADSLRGSARRAATTTTQLPVVDSTIVETTRTTVVPVATTPFTTDAPTTTTTIPEVVPTTSVATPVGKRLVLVPHIKEGQVAAGSAVEAKAEGLAPNTPVILELHSQVRVLGQQAAASDGSAAFDVQLPADVESGAHMLVLRGTSPDGSPIAAVAPFLVGDDGVVDKVLPVSVGTTVPDQSKLARMTTAGATPYDPESDFSGVAALAAAAVVVMGIASGGSGGGSKRSSDDGGNSDASSNEPERTDGPPDRDETSEGSLSSADAKYLDVVGTESESWGDRSILWRAPGWGIIRGFLGRLVRCFDDKSTLIVRLLQDGAWVRAAFGSLGILPWLIGIVLGVASAVDVDSMALPPTSGFVVAIVSLAFVDALAGALAWLAFSLIVIGSGNVSSWFDVRTLLGLGVLYACLPIIGAAIRPIVRNMDGSRDDLMQRVGDYVMMPVFLGYAAASVYGALNGLSGLEVVSPTATNLLRNVCFGVVVGRLLVEDASTRLFPRRRADAALKAERGTGAVVAHVNVLVLWAVFLLTAAPYFGLGWRTWLIVTLMSVVPLAKIHKGSLPNVAALHRWFPRGILRATILLFVGAYFGRWIHDVAGNPADARTLAPFLMLPGIVIG
ncbi:MAG: hypothetical protein RJB08_434, partial [Actinomycetota bacterium]